MKLYHIPKNSIDLQVTMKITKMKEYRYNSFMHNRIDVDINLNISQQQKS